MDEMKIKLSTKFMRGLVAKLIRKVVYQKTGYNIDILLNEIGVQVVNGRARIHADVDVEIDEKEFLKITKVVEDM